MGLALSLLVAKIVLSRANPTKDTALHLQSMERTVNDKVRLYKALHSFQNIIATGVDEMTATL